MKYRHKQSRTRGASIILVAVCAGLLILGIVACFQLAMMLGGAQEMNYTADAAALNVAKRSMEIKTEPGSAYSDCADSSGLISLANINRVWGKAYIINANQAEFVANQKATDQSTAAADQAFATAQQVNDNLCASVGSMPTLNSFFDQIAGQRLNRMLGQKVVTGGTVGNPQYWHSSLVYRGQESNLAFNPVQIYNPSGSYIGGIQTDNKLFMQGYEPLEMNSKNFYFVSFRPVEMPHLISASFFKQNTPDINQLAKIVNPLPNAFAGYGKASNSNNVSDTAAYAIANPMRQYNLAIPHAFISVQLANIAHWMVQGKEVNVTNYGFAPETQFGADNIPLGLNSFLNGYASLGNEPKGSLWDAFQSIKGDDSKVLEDMTVRLQQIKLDFTAGNLQQLLQQQQVVNDTDTYLIYPAYTTPDNTSPTIQIIPLTPQTVKNLPAWINVDAANEAQSRVYVQQDQSDDSPNYNWEMVVGSAYIPGPHWVTEGAQINWQPGTGFNQTLGQVSIIHNTFLYFTATPVNNSH